MKCQQFSNGNGKWRTLLSDKCIEMINRKRYTRYKFENLSKGRIRGKEDRHSHYRKGTSNNWKEYFRGDHKKRFIELFGDILIITGYEKNENWLD